jgi:hypothetical protein
MRPSVKPLGAFLVAAALLGAACARAGAVRGGIDHPTGAHDLILRIDLEGGFLPLQAQFRQLPVFALYGDGRIIVPGPQIEIYPGPALPNLQVRTVSDAGIQAILAAARKAGLLGSNRHYDNPRIADAPTTTFTVVANGSRHVVSVYALGMEGPGDSYPSDRSVLAAFQGKLSDLQSWLPAGSLGPEGPFRTDELRVYVMPYQPPEDLAQPPMDWPGGSFGGFLPVVDLTYVRCGTVSGSALPAALSAAGSAKELTPWRADGQRWTLVFRPLLPDESGCR